MINQKINYIHSNPVRARLVKSTAEYRWSSFHSFYNDEVDPLLQTDKDWWWPDDVMKLTGAMKEKQEELDRKFSPNVRNEYWPNKSGGEPAFRTATDELIHVY